LKKEVFFFKDGKSFAEFFLEGKNMYKTRQKDKKRKKITTTNN
jgi:hypothetical protein